MRIPELAGLESSEAMRQCFASLDSGAPEDYRELAALLACRWTEARRRPRFVGLCGGQGTGKTTLSGLIVDACGSVGLRACVLHLDDFYLTRSEREALAVQAHPLLRTRGVPGTHDMALCRSAMRALAFDEAVSIPVFDKGTDDRCGERGLQGPFDLVLLEGWCIGARAEPEAARSAPVNALESEQDPEGVWRRFVEESLERDYEPVWDDLDVLVYLRAPDLDAVKRWRLEQEAAIPEALRLGAAAVDRFVSHYQRITDRMALSLSQTADWRIDLDAAHRVSSVSRPSG